MLSGKPFQWELFSAKQVLYKGNFERACWHLMRTQHRAWSAVCYVTMVVI